jgi:hypothetical protein
MLAEKIRAMLTDVPARNAAHNWQRTYVQRFDVGEVGKRFLDVYARALQNRRR